MEFPETWSTVLDLTQAHALPVPWLPDDVTSDLVVSGESDSSFGRVWTRELQQTGESDLESALIELGSAAPNRFASFAVIAPSSPSAPLELEYVLSGPEVHVELDAEIGDDPSSLEVARTVLHRLSGFARRRWRSVDPRMAAVVWPDISAVGPLEAGLPEMDWMNRHGQSPQALVEVLGDDDPR